jgi:hypothetical protein
VASRRAKACRHPGFLDSVPPRRAHTFQLAARVCIRPPCATMVRREGGPGMRRGKGQRFSDLAPPEKDGQPWTAGLRATNLHLCPTFASSTSTSAACSL